MNKRFLIPAAVLALSLPALYADIGENFARGGISLSGSISFFNNFYYFLDDTEQRKFWSIELSPGFDWYVADKVALTFSPWFYYESYTQDPSNIFREMDYGLRIGVDYAFVRNPAAQRGLVFAVGGSLGVGFYPTVKDLVGGVETPNNYSRVDLILYLRPRLYFFLNDRLAPFVGVTPQLGYILSYKDPSGLKVKLTSQESLRATVTATVGMSFFVPNKKASLLLTNSTH